MMPIPTKPPSNHSQVGRSTSRPSPSASEAPSVGSADGESDAPGGGGSTIRASPFGTRTR